MGPLGPVTNPLTEGYKAHKAAQNIPPAPKASDFKKPKSFLIAQKHYAKILVSREAEAVRAGVSHFMAPSLCRPPVEC